MPDGGSPAAPLRRAWVEVDLGALARNFARLSKHVAPARVLPVVKADAYGHGVLAVASALEPLGAPGFAVALVEEGIELRQAGVRAPVLVLSPTPEGAEDVLIAYRLQPAVSGLDQLDRLEARAQAARAVVDVHLKFDTGMTRLGIADDVASAVLERVRRSSSVRLAGLMSHLAEAETPASPANSWQLTRFRELVGRLSAAERERVVVHLANSAGGLLAPPTRFDLVRSGLALYGLGPGRGTLGLEPVLAVRARLVLTRDVEPGTRAGYGGRWEALRASRVGVVPLGYADGYPWRAEGRAEALVRGRRAPLAGAVSMDLILLDLTDTGGEIGDVVTLLGRDGAEEITAEELADQAGTIVYEVLCHLGLRLPHNGVRGARAEAGEDAVEEPAR
jgi:alanine racemase